MGLISWAWLALALAEPATAATSITAAASAAPAAVAAPGDITAPAGVTAPAMTAATAPTDVTTAVVAPPAPVVNFAGRVLERGTQRPLADAQVVIADLGYTALTDKQGRYEFEDVPAGTYDIVVPLIGYQRYKTSEQISETERTDVVYYLEPDYGSPLEVVVEAEKVKKEVSRTTLKREEIRKIPGTGGDTIKVVTSLPGVATSNELGSDIIVRGSGPFDNTIEIDRIEVPYIFHFGAFRSVLNGDLVDTLDFQAGGFGANFGEATGGILLANTRAGRKDRFGGAADINVAMAEGFVEGPVAGGKGSFVAAARRSYFDLIIRPVFEANADPEDIKFSVFPQFYDYQARFDYDLVTDATVKVFAFGADDIIALSTRPNPREPEVDAFSVHPYFHVAGTGLRNKWGKLTNSAQLYVEWLGQELAIGKGNFLNFYTTTPGLTNDAAIRFNKRNTLNFGAQIKTDFLTFKSRFPEPPKQGQTDFTFSDAPLVDFEQRFKLVRTGLYADDMIYVTDDWMIDPGVRVDIYHQDRTYNYVDPRILTRYEATKRLTLKGAVGRYSQFATEQQLDDTFGSPSLEPIHSTHYVAGVEYKITESDALDVQSYYKWLDNLVFSYPTGQKYRNTQIGEAYGFEIFLRHYQTQRFFGWLSYAYSRSFRKFPDDGKWVPAGFDQPHIINAVGSYKLSNRWEAGFKWRFSSGNPNTPYVDHVYIADKSIYIPIPGERNSERLPPTHRLDARIEYSYPFPTWTMRFYLEVLNVYAASSPVDYNDNYDYTAREPIALLPIPVPLFGVRAEF